MTINETRAVTFALLSALALGLTGGFALGFVAGCLREPCACATDDIKASEKLATPADRSRRVAISSGEIGSRTAASVANAAIETLRDSRERPALLAGYQAFLDAGGIHDVDGGTAR